MPLSQADRDLRRCGITATDAAVIAGVNPWRCTDEVFASKVTDEAPWLGNMRTEFGHAAEPLLCAWLARERGLVLLPASTEKHSLLEWVLATPDRDVVFGKTRSAVVEAKLVGPRVAHHWLDADGDLQVPAYVSCQVQWQMFARRVRVAYVVVYFAGDDEPKSIEVPYNDDLAAALVAMGERFWFDHVVPRIPPTPTARESYKEMIARVWPKSRPGTIIEAPAEAAEVVYRYAKARSEEKAATEAKELFGNQLRAMLGEFEGFECDEFKATWKSNAVGVPKWKDVALAAIELLRSNGVEIDPATLIAEHMTPPVRAINVRVTPAKAETAQDKTEGEAHVSAA